jgi:hypothetical protein
MSVATKARMTLNVKASVTPPTNWSEVVGADETIAVETPSPMDPPAT